MTRKDIDIYLSKLEVKLLSKEKKTLELSYAWKNTFKEKAAVYIIWKGSKICYVGETSNLRKRMNDLRYTKKHTLRRNYGNDCFKDHPKYKKPNTNNKFCDEIEDLLNKKMATNLFLSYEYVKLGRKELEERICEKYHFDIYNK